MFKTGVKVKVVSPTRDNRMFDGLIGEVISCTTNSLNHKRVFCVEFTSCPRVIYGFFKYSELAFAYSNAYQDVYNIYLQRDIAATQALFESMFGVSKTVVKCQSGDTFDPEKGLAMAIAKRVYGDNGHYCELFKKWIPDSDEKIVLDLGQEFADSLAKAASAAAATFNTFGSMLKKKGE